MDKAVDEAAVKVRAAVPAITVRTGWCKACGYCADFCPRDVLAMREALPAVLDPTRCSRCMLCVLICPDFAIRVE